ncbi:ABC transporter ATP-binding protein [Longivirga aurantiaca]|uniref:ABC transporter ATP-binding protein n=1 Tax=Longivirga aurantiaca TaxID=1837743 RepID=A0ABW1SYY1_9ACTN
MTPATVGDERHEPWARADVPPPTVQAAIVLDRVTKRFDRDGSRPAVLQDVSLTVAEGEFVSLLGASGCGKSTLLALVAGLEAPTSGTVATPGGHAALMFQESALFPWLTAGQNIELALKLRGVPRAERRDEAERLLDVVHLAGQHKSRVHELSGGMRQRVALARALGQDARILLMDEPFASLDAITRDVLHEELIRVWEATGLSVVFVTHNVREAVRLGQRVELMSSRPGRFVRRWEVEIEGPRRIESAGVSELSKEITDDLRREIRRHAVPTPSSEVRS